MKSLKKDIHDFVKSVITHRKSLITGNKSSINKMKALLAIEKLERNNHDFKSDIAASKFLINSLEDIRFLMKIGDTEKEHKLQKLLAAAEPLSKL